MSVYAQKNKENEWASVPVFLSVKGFIEKGQEIIPYCYEDIDNLNITKDDIVVGGVPCVRKALSKHNITLPELSIPDKCLLKYCNRNFEIKTLEEINKLYYKENIEKFFIKPYEHHKLFTGHVVSDFRDSFKTMNLPLETKVVCSDYVEFKSEYRIFLINGKIAGMSHYHGDCLLFPNKEIIKKLTSDAYDCYKLEGFSVDVGVTDDNQTLLVEINDGFSLGAYGLNYLVYTLLIEERWKQLFR